VTIYIWPGMKVVLFCLERWPNKCMDLEKLFVGTITCCCWVFFFCQEIICLIVFKSDLVQGLGFRFWPGCLDQFFLKKSKWHRFSKRKKTKVNVLQPGFWLGLTGSHLVFSSPIFCSTWPGSSPRSTCRAGPGFKTINF
jgi:hypothetical protein